MTSKLKRFFSGKKWRHGVFMVVYKIEKGKPKFLIQKRKLHWKGYEFPKGGLEKGETRIKGIKREIFEETGLPIKKIKNHHKRGRWLYEKELKDRPGLIGQTWSLYSAKVGEGKVRLDKKEHFSAEWLSYREARKKLTYQNQKVCLDFVWEWLKK
jgi:8-oxo-dGTP pyrophosphatase MutT (NUDIX family)